MITDKNEKTAKGKRGRRAAGKEKKVPAFQPQQAPDDGKARRLARIAALSVGLAIAAVLVCAGLAVTTASRMNAIAGNTVSVAVATKSIAAGQAVTQDSYRLADVPGAYVPADAATAASLDSIDGKPAAVAIGAGSVLAKSDVVGSGSGSSLSGEIAQGNVSITLACDEENGFSGLLVIGDIVDVIDYSSGETVCANARVIGLGGSLAKQDKGYASVSLEVGAVDAAAITAHESDNKVRVVLHSAADRR